MYVCQLSEYEQQKIREQIINRLQGMGYSDNELEEFAQLAMNSRVSDLDLSS